MRGGRRLISSCQGTQEKNQGTLLSDEDAPMADGYDSR